MEPSPIPHPFVSASSWARLVKILLFAGAIVSGLSLISAGAGLVVPPLSEDQEVAENLGGFALALVDVGLGLLAIVLYLLTIVFFLIWLYRAYRNLPAFGTPKRSLNYSAGMAVGSFFIPFVNLVLPYRIIKDLWRNSIPADEVFLGPNSPPSWFPLWWGFWLVSGFVGNIYFRAAFNETVSESIVIVLGVLSDSLSIIAAVFAMVIVGEIDQRQEESSSKLKLGKHALPPAPPTVGSQRVEQEPESPSTSGLG